MHNRSQFKLQSIAAYVASLGQNIQFVAFWAHLGVAALAVIVAGRFGWYVAAAIAGAAGIKEYWFDAQYELNPPQTFRDNTEDFIGWAGGVMLGLWIGWLMC